MPSFRIIAALVVTIVAAGEVAAESGRIGNKLDVPVTYLVGQRDANGSIVEWTEHKLIPCETQTWTWELREGETGLPITWPMWVDQRKDENGNVISSGHQIPLNADGTALVVFIRYGDQIWLDSSANARMDDCAAPETVPTPTETVPVTPTVPTETSPPPASSTPSEAALEELSYEEALQAKLDTLIARSERGEIFLLELGGEPQIHGTVYPIEVTDFVALVLLQVASGELSEAEAARVLAIVAEESATVLPLLKERAEALRQRVKE